MVLISSLKVITVIYLLSTLDPCLCQENRKDVLDYNDADMEALYKQWEENDDEKEEEDERLKDLPPDLKDNEGVATIEDLEKARKDPEGMIKLMQKGKQVLLTVLLVGDLDHHEQDRLTSLWHHGLYQGHVEVSNRRKVSDKVYVFLFDDGSQAWPARDFILRQKECGYIQMGKWIFRGAGWSESFVEKYKLDPNVVTDTPNKEDWAKTEL